MSKYVAISDMCSDAKTGSSSNADESYNADCEEGDTTYIEICINSIENIIRDDVLHLKIIVDHNNRVLGRSKTITIDSNFEKIAKEYVIEFSVMLHYNAQDIRSICSIASAPATITVYEINEAEDMSLEEGLLEEGTRVMGLCNLDLVPILFGEDEFVEKLVLEVPTLDWDGKAVSWLNLPRLQISAVRNECSFNPAELGCFNLLNITIESLYNPPEFFDKDSEYKCATLLLSENLESEDEPFVVYEAGKWTNYHDVEQMKIWEPLQHLESRAKFSKYKLDADVTHVKNDYRNCFCLKEAMKSDKERIEWNCMHRIAMDPKGVEKLQEHIKKFRNWPFEVMVINKKRDSKGIEESRTTIYQCYADVSQLLYPGRTKARVLAQLYERNDAQLERNTGVPISVFEFIARHGLEGNEKNASSSLASTLQSEEGEQCDEYPLFNDDDDPVLLLVEFELWQPFMKARVLEDYNEALEKLRNLPRAMNPLYCFTPDLAHDAYTNCIQQMNDVIVDEYRDFLERCDCETDFDKRMIAKTKEAKDNLCNCSSDCSMPETHDNITCPYAYLPDEVHNFRQYLHETGSYGSIRSTMKKTVATILDQKFAFNYGNWDSQENQDVVARIYSYLVQEMHTALNKKLDCRLSADYRQFTAEEDYWYRSEEAYEFENFEKSENFLTQIVSAKREDPNSWVLYAIYFMKRSQIDDAIECCREAIRIDCRHKIALIFYGVLMAVKEEFKDAELFLQAVVQFYPRCIEAWTILHIFYVKIQYYPGIDVTLRIAEQCLKDRVHEEDPDLIVMREEPLVWSTLLGHVYDVFALTTVFLLKLNLFKFATFSILMMESAKDECQSVVYLHFLSVIHYLQGDYCEAIGKLSKAQEILGMDYSICSLLGHSLYKTGQLCQAVELYEAVDTLYERPENIHLVHMRMGYFYIDRGDYDRARSVFLRASRYPPTSKTWLGLGISCYFLKIYKDCELALTEANRIDDEDPVVWGYLCLLNLELRRQPEFTQCYRQTIKNELKCKKLWKLIEESMENTGFKVPISIFDDYKKRCTCPN